MKNIVPERDATPEEVAHVTSARSEIAESYIPNSTTFAVAKPPKYKFKLCIGDYSADGHEHATD